MAEEATPESPAASCPWCSAPLAAPDAANCPSCGAALHGEADAQVPGLTTVDRVAVLEGMRPAIRPRNRLVAWLTGGDIEEEAETAPATAEALGPPPPEVRREMLRLQMEAELTQLTAEVESRATDEAVAMSESGDEAGAKAAVDAIRETEASVEALVETPEERQLAGEGAGAAGDFEAPAGSALDTEIVETAEAVLDAADSTPDAEIRGA
jgi:hypothetical protein